MMTNHYFIAVQLNNELQSMLSDWQEKLRKENELKYKSWTSPDDLHITLKFLGGLEEDTIELLKKKLLSINTIHPFFIEINGLGIFGNANQPRVLWTGVEPSQGLFDLQKEVEKICVECGLKAENRPYRPHITLAKKWKGEKINPTFIKELSLDFIEKKDQLVKDFVLYQIHPSRSPKYEVVQSVLLK
ncbi:RNA 2',3'-cyclic phosphodiesterase [Aquibacillus salsiterrae]|uniref:RNA 2',3'-cyclic phosphodiesterase n=1 Tax=Aquibacillus salsiterrae TaxID=2950439 RepID=A0A9X4AF92_9BACI|nr:RNA 2',3'-cyclic phosphodiesterase [Aquibacillus salsiterrae]MDC3415808.1 RNA 2',3'-cyclic phosphodiesterase [Aquibacillus salsiterrae]